MFPLADAARYLYAHYRFMEGCNAVHQIFVCSSCCRVGETPQGAAFVAALRKRLGAHFAIAAHACFSVCSEPQALAFRAPGKAAYVFSGLNLDDLEDIAAFAQLWSGLVDGWIEDARPIGRLRFCLKARIPATPIQPEQ